MSPSESLAITPFSFFFSGVPVSHLFNDLSSNLKFTLLLFLNRISSPPRPLLTTLTNQAVCLGLHFYLPHVFQDASESPTKVLWSYLPVPSVNLDKIHLGLEV